MNGAEECPLGLDLGVATQEKLAKAAGLLDLAEDRLDHLLAQAVAAAPGAALEPRRHGGDPAAAPLGPIAGGRRRAMLLPAGGDVAPDVALLEAVCRCLARCRRLRLGLQRRSRRPDLRQPLLLAGNPRRKLVATLLGAMRGILRCVARRRLGKPPRYLGGQPGLGLVHPPVA